MANETLADELLTMIKSETVNNPAPQKCRITKVYDDMHVDVESLRGLLKYVQVFGTNVKKGDDGVLLFLNETYDDYVVLSGNGSSGGGGGDGLLVGSFRINDDGHLIATLPHGASNPYHINNEGHLIYDTEAI